MLNCIFFCQNGDHCILISPVYAAVVSIGAVSRDCSLLLHASRKSYLTFLVAIRLSSAPPAFMAFMAFSEPNGIWYVCTSLTQGRLFIAGCFDPFSYSTLDTYCYTLNLTLQYSMLLICRMICPHNTTGVQSWIPKLPHFILSGLPVTVTATATVVTTAVPFGAYTAYILRGLSPKGKCSTNSSPTRCALLPSLELLLLTCEY